MQKEILKKILLFFEQRPASSEKHLVHSVLLKIGGRDPNGTKPIVTYIVTALSVASCFEINIQQ